MVRVAATPLGTYRSHSGIWIRSQFFAFWLSFEQKLPISHDINPSSERNRNCPPGMVPPENWGSIPPYGC